MFICSQPVWLDGLRVPVLETQFPFVPLNQIHSKYKCPLTRQHVCEDVLTTRAPLNWFRSEDVSSLAELDHISSVFLLDLILNLP